MDALYRVATPAALTLIGIGLLAIAFRTPAHAGDPTAGFRECTAVFYTTGMPGTNSKKFNAGQTEVKHLIPTNGWTPVTMSGANTVLYCR